MRLDRGSLLIAFAAVAYGVQAALDLSWEPLHTWQHDESFRRWSGLALTLVIAAQVVFALYRRTQDAARARQIRRAHRLVGVLSLIPLYLHATSPGYGLLLVLGALIPAQVLVGALSPAEGPRTRWRLLHGLLATLLLAGTGIHVWMVFAWS
ncbi:MAG: hypothetical protein GY913_05840 [Proteobacteria bacterium]|nr:hypothetical protein [Pseudomonadota bacterium]MCP4916426.1 hypothetical protein [Pseudomonadota bacterium]